jgi:hypothetical protein
MSLCIPLTLITVFFLLCLKYACGFRDLNSAVLIVDDFLMVINSVLLRIDELFGYFSHYHFCSTQNRKFCGCY